MLLCSLCVKTYATYEPFPHSVFKTSFIPLTASALLLNAACSSLFSLKSRIFSHPFFPMLDTRNRWFNGKYGILAFVDQGRVWQPGEKSDKWHVGYGGGIFVAPFNRILLNATYGISEEDQVVHLRLGFLF